MDLSIKEIIDAFPDECEKLVPKLIREYKRELKPYHKACKRIRLKYYDQATEMILLFAIKLRYKPDDYEAGIRRLRKIQYTLHPPKDGMITPAMIDDAKQVPIATLYDFEKIRTGYSRFTACCPFHEDSNPSFVVYPNNTFYCFSGCHIGGDSIAFIMKLNGLSFRQAVKFLLTQ